MVDKSAGKMGLSYEHYFDATPGIISVQDRDLKIVGFNSRLEELFGNPGESRCYEFFKRQFLVVVGIEADIAHAMEQLAERRFLRQIPAQHEGVDKESNHVLRVCRQSSCDRSPNRDVFFTGVAVE